MRNLFTKEIIFSDEASIFLSFKCNYKRRQLSKVEEIYYYSNICLAWLENKNNLAIFLKSHTSLQLHKLKFQSGHITWQMVTLFDGWIFYFHELFKCLIFSFYK